MDLARVKKEKAYEMAKKKDLIRQIRALERVSIVRSAAGAFLKVVDDHAFLINDTFFRDANTVFETTPYPKKRTCRCRKYTFGHSMRFWRLRTEHLQSFVFEKIDL